MTDARAGRQPSSGPPGLRVFITGASSGLGEALAWEYTRRGGNEAKAPCLGLVARRGERLQALAAALTAQRADLQVAIYPIDITSRADLSAAAADFVTRFGAPDVVIANAGISVGTHAGEPGDAEVFERLIRLNLIAVNDTFASFIPAMTTRGSGRLVAIASVKGVRGFPGSGAYSASKAAVITYCESLRVDLHGTGVSVVTIAPGYVRTELTQVNRYKMPFIIAAPVFAAAAVSVIEAGHRYRVIPRRMAIVARLLSWLPNVVYDRLIARAPRKARGPHRDSVGPSAPR